MEICNYAVIYDEDLQTFGVISENTEYAAGLRPMNIYYEKILRKGLFFPFDLEKEAEEFAGLLNKALVEPQTIELR